MSEEAVMQFEHKWAFVIIPVDEVQFPAKQQTATEALLAAYCKHCDTYYTKTLFWTSRGSMDGKAGIPRFGCVGPEGRF